MNNQIETIMALADEYMAQERDGTNGYEARQALKQALEAALKPGEPVAWSYTSAFGSVQVFTSEPPSGLKEKCVPLYTAAPPAQTPPPRLTDEQIKAIWKDVDGFYSLVRAIETAVRKQFGVNDE